MFGVGRYRAIEANIQRKKAGKSEIVTVHPRTDHRREVHPVMRRIELEMHEGDEPVTVSLVRREDGSVARAHAGEGSVRTLELLLGEDLGDDTWACDELLEAIRSVESGASGVVDLAWDLTELEVRQGTSKVRLSVPDGGFDWINVSTRELEGAVRRLRAFAAGAG